MKIFQKITYIIGFWVLAACSLDDIENPNAPTVGSFEQGASQQDLRLLTTGIEAVVRNDLEFHYETVSILGREYYDLTQVDPRYTGELLVGPLDNNGFLTTRAYTAWYKVVQSADLLLNAVDNSTTPLSVQALDGYRGYARTWKAYGLLTVANRQYTNGIRVDVSDPDNLGPFISYDAALEEIRTILENAYTELINAASEFPEPNPGEDDTETFDFDLSSGFDGFDTPSTFAAFNRALTARVAIYQNNKADVLTLLNDSFLDEAASLDLGPSHVFGLTGNDIANPLFYVPDQDRYMAHPSFATDAEVGDTRLSKVRPFNPEDSDPNPITVSFDRLSSPDQVAIYSSNVDPVPIIKNEELILLYAEANIGTDNAEAIRALNIIRADAGLGASSANVASDSEVESELLAQRRYSLFGEGHRWIDMRRFNRLSELPIDRAGDVVLDAFPTPFAENQ